MSGLPPNILFPTKKGTAVRGPQGQLMMMGTQQFTMNPMALVFFILIVILGITDLGFVVFGGTGSSLSSWLVGNSYSAYIPTLSIMLFSIGCICGHLFFGMKPEIPKNAK